MTSEVKKRLKSGQAGVDVPGELEGVLVERLGKLEQRLMKDGEAREARLVKVVQNGVMELFSAGVCRPATKEAGCTQVPAYDHLDADMAWYLALFSDGKWRRFKSSEQEEALQHVKHGRRHLVVILPTGGGKALLWMLPAKTFWQSKTVVVIVPLHMLMEDCLRRCQEAGVHAAVWGSGDSNPRTSVVFASAEDAVHGGFRAYMEQLQVDKQLVYVFLEEAHLVLEAKSYRKSLPELQWLYSLAVPVAVLSATLPPPAVDTLRTRLNVDTWLVIRAPRTIADVDLHVRLQHSQEKVVEAAVQQVGEWKEVHRSVDVRCLVVCVSKTQVEQVVRATGAPYIVSEMADEQKRGVFQAWVHGEEKVLVGMTACGTGLDVGRLNQVIMVGAMFNAMTVIQLLGRLRGEGSAYLFATERPWVPHRDGDGDDGDIVGVEVLKRVIWEEKTCRFGPLTAYNDGRPTTCASRRSSCDLCAARASARASVRRPVTARYLYLVTGLCDDVDNDLSRSQHAHSRSYVTAPFKTGVTLRYVWLV